MASESWLSSRDDCLQPAACAVPSPLHSLHSVGSVLLESLMAPRLTSSGGLRATGQRGLARRPGPASEQPR